ncbi:MAG: helix-turn-helix transcriptional regulator [Dactylosporangium sp.]|nr:helix-turn-helix transcriptional regulator [Dactylosporangium sp.]NNJ62746.1 helix-turn-helix transcriptional regulator [Dactylosporangium sp.]
MIDDVRAGLGLGTESGSDAKVFIISIAAKLAGMHPQTLRQYDRLGLVNAGRTQGGGRRYSARDVAMLREIQRLSQEEGVNLAGIKRIIGLEQLVGDLQERLAETERELLEAQRHLAELAASAFPRRDLMVAPKAQTALVVWRPNAGR